VRLPAVNSDSVLIGIELVPICRSPDPGDRALADCLDGAKASRSRVWRFLKVGALVMPPALLLATLAVWLMSG